MRIFYDEVSYFKVNKRNDRFKAFNQSSVTEYFKKFKLFFLSFYFFVCISFEILNIDLNKRISTLSIKLFLTNRS